MTLRFRFETAYYSNLEDKVELLASVPNYTSHPRESIEAMAKFCRRVWFKPDSVIVEQVGATLFVSGFLA